MGDARWLQLAEIAEQRACRRHGKLVTGPNPKALERVDGELPRELGPGQLRVELPRITLRHQRIFLAPRLSGHRR